MFAVVDPNHRMRASAEAAIRAAYFREHGARLDALPRLLVADFDEAGIVCAAGLRFAADGFFSERYLDQPVEQLVARHTGIAAHRADLAEVGSLAAARPGAVVPLVAGIVALLRDAGIRYAFFTATARLRTLLRRSGIPLVELAAADSGRVADAEAWGRYYHHDPRVMLVGDYMLGGALRPPTSTMPPASMLKERNHA